MSKIDLQRWSGRLDSNQRDPASEAGKINQTPLRPVVKMVVIFGLERRYPCPQGRWVSRYPTSRKYLNTKAKGPESLRIGADGSRIVPLGSGPRARVLIDGPLGHDCFRTALGYKACWQESLEME